MNTAIIVAAGSGERFRSDTPKQFLSILGKTVVEWTVERFTRAPSVDEVILVLHPDRIDTFSRECQNLPTSVRLVAGGSSRMLSVKNGLAAVSHTCEIVAVHDGARPLVSVDEIEQTIEAAKRAGAACLVGAVTDTIKSIRGDEIAGTLDREQLRRALTPQAFRAEVLKKAFEDTDANTQATDECYLVEKLGHPVVIIEGRETNIKITYPNDMALAELILSREMEANRAA